MSNISQWSWRAKEIRKWVNLLGKLKGREIWNEWQGLPCWSSGWDSACQCRGHGFDPWSRKIPHATGQLSPCTTTLSPHVTSYRSPHTLEPVKKCSEVARSCLTLWDPMDHSLPGSSIHGIFQARVLEWAAISFSRGSSQPRDWTHCIADRRLTIWATREA